MNASNPKFIPISDLYFTGNEKKYVLEAVESGWISSQGVFVKKFEEAFAKFSRTHFATSCTNGTAALHLAYQACGIARGDEVIMPNLTFVATANSAAYLGAKPVFVDVEPNTWNINSDLIEKKITPKTKAIVPVHLYGVPCDMKPILEIAQKNDLKVIEDCAESHGAKYRGKKTGSLGHCAAFSFFANKILTTGEGGMVTSNDPEIISRINFLKNQGMDPQRRYWHPEIGYNYRMTALQAAFGLGQLEGIETAIRQKQRIATYYEKNLPPLHGLSFQQTTLNSKRVYWMFNILVNHPQVTRNQLSDKLKNSGIDSRPVFFPLNHLPPYQSKESFPETERISQQGISLPSGATLSKDHLERIVETIKSILS